MIGITAALTQALVIGGDASFHWTAGNVVLSIFLFFLAGLCEIGGGWLVWQVCSFVVSPCKHARIADVTG